MRAFCFVLATAFLVCLGPVQQLRADSEAIRVQDVPRAVMDAVSGGESSRRAGLAAACHRDGRRTSGHPRPGGSPSPHSRVR
jgi:hypothetical protein